MVGGVIFVNSTPVIPAARSVNLNDYVIPAQAGIHFWPHTRWVRGWIPACAGMTNGLS